MSKEPVTALFIAFTNPLPGKEAEFNEWYTHTHLKEVVAVPGFISARRFKLTKEQRTPTLPFQYMAIYEVEVGKARFVLDSLEAGLPMMLMPPVIDMENGAGVLVESICDTVRASSNGSR